VTLAAAALLGALAGGCTSDVVDLSPGLRVDRLDLDTNCYRPCSGGLSGVVEDTEGLCAGEAAVSCGFVAGLGKMRVVAEVDVDVAPEQGLQAPTLVVIADGAPEAVPAGRIVERTTGRRPRYSAVLDVPPRDSATLAFHFEVLDGYEVEVTGLDVVKPSLTTEVFGCQDGQECTLPAGVGKTTVSVIAPAGLTDAGLRQWVDDEPFPDVTMTSIPSSPGMVEWRAAPDTPARQDGRWRLQATVGPYPASDREVLLGAPDMALAIVGCEGAECPRQAGVGQVELTLETPKDFTGASLLQWVDGVPRTPVAFTKGPVLGEKLLWTHSIPMLTQEGAVWRFQAASDGFTSADRQVQIIAPLLKVSPLSCSPAEDCKIPAGSEVQVEVVAPAGLSPTTVTLKAKLDGVPDGQPGTPVSLDEVIGQERRGYFKTTVPAAVGKVWTLRVLVNQSASPDSQPVFILPSTN
jgi:hypothetical protein